MNVFYTRVGRAGITRFINDLIELVTRYKDRIAGVVRVEYRQPEEKENYVYTYALVVKPIKEGFPYWIPYCSKNTTNFSGEGGSGHRKIEEHLKKLNIPIQIVTVADDASEDIENEERIISKEVEALV